MPNSVLVKPRISFRPPTSFVMKCLIKKNDSDSFTMAKGYSFPVFSFLP